MQFQVPQFIEVEDKIFGPLTFKQFIYLTGGAGLSFIVYTALKSFLPLFVILIPILFIVALSLALTFYKVNNKPFINILEAAFKYTLGHKLYIWKKENKKPVGKVAEETDDSSGIYVPKLSDSKLKDLAWSLDIHESIYTSKNQR